MHLSFLIDLRIIWWSSSDKATLWRDWAWVKAKLIKGTNFLNIRQLRMLWPRRMAVSQLGHQLGYLTLKLMLRWHSPFNRKPSKWIIWLVFILGINSIPLRTRSMTCICLNSPPEYSVLRIWLLIATRPFGDSWTAGWDWIHSNSALNARDNYVCPRPLCCGEELTGWPVALAHPIFCFFYYGINHKLSLWLCLPSSLGISSWVTFTNFKETTQR